ncbi:uncharacterized protein AB9W97_017323 [Spinachia spinachia]
MEAEVVYSTVVFKGAAPQKKTNEATIDPKGEREEAAPDEKAAACSRFAALVAWSGILCVLLVASITVIIYLSSVMTEERGNLSELRAEKELLLMEISVLSSVTDNLNWTLGVIMHFSIFPVYDFCPDKECQPCRKGWVRFQGKCYLFPTVSSPWNTWEDSLTDCRNVAADLAVIDNLHEQEFIRDHAKYYYDRFHGYWLGLRKVEGTHWLWVDGRNDTLGSRENSAMSPQCGLMVPEASDSWTPSYCFMRNRFICEADVLIR